MAHSASRNEGDPQGWDSRFGEVGTRHIPASAALPSRTESDIQRLLSSLLSLVRNNLPYIHPEYLEFNAPLGHGSSFEVTREVLNREPQKSTPMLVAVKRIKVTQSSGETKESRTELMSTLVRLRSVIREVQVLTHPKLRAHSCIISAIGWGWSPGGEGSNRPYLVMDYSSEGSLDRFAQIQSLRLLDRRYLILDVALGLRALHDCDIIHGDVKPHNVLVYGSGTRTNEHERHFQARLADFGSTLFDHDFSHAHTTYLGTPRYNAPEIRNAVKEPEDSDHESSNMVRFKAADCYSFGILLWETVKAGKSFIEPDWLEHGEDAHEFLDRILHTKEDALLDLALHFLRNAEASTMEEYETRKSNRSLQGISNPNIALMKSALASWPIYDGHLDNIDTIPDAESFRVLRSTIGLCLRDEYGQRGCIDEIVGTLSDGFDGTVPEYRELTLQTHIPLPMAPDVQPGDHFEKLRREHSPFNRGLQLSNSRSDSHLKMSLRPKDEPPNPAYQIVVAPPDVQCQTIIVTPQDYRFGAEDMFKALLGKHVPWHVQCKAAEHIDHEMQRENELERKAEAQLQLSIMFYIGYGLPPDRTRALDLLEDASKYNEVARVIYERLQHVIERNDLPCPVTGTPEPDCLTYKDPVIILDGLKWRDARKASNDNFFSLGPITVASFKVFAHLVKKRRFDSRELVEALAASCRDGNTEAALLLAQQPLDLSQASTKTPNPLHWLVMFDPMTAKRVLEALVAAPSEGAEMTRSEAIRHLLASDHEGTTVILPHRCVELQGTPLHWAAMLGYTDLVKSFISLGADVNKRSAWRAVYRQEFKRYPYLSPLDIAVACHFPKIVKILLDEGCEVYGGDWFWRHSAFHMIGFDKFPFGRYMAHGGAYRTALQQTIRLLQAGEQDINVLDSQKNTPLALAVAHLDIEQYILEELLDSGAATKAESEEKEGNLVISAIIGCAHRRYSWWKIPLLLPQVSDINAGSIGAVGFNALHMCAYTNAELAAGVLLSTPAVNINALSASGHTALSLAAQRNSTEVLELLLRRGADPKRGSAVERAVLAGHVDVVRRLVEAGADIRYAKRSTGNPMTILCDAIQYSSKHKSYVRQYLEQCPRLRTSEALHDAYDASKRTALHLAAQFADDDGVSALLKFGADPHRMDRGGKTALDVAMSTIEQVTRFERHPWLDAEHDHLVDTGRNELTIPLRFRFLDRLSDIVSMLKKATSGAQ